MPEIALVRCEVCGFEWDPRERLLGDKGCPNATDHPEVHRLRSALATASRERDEVLHQLALAEDSRERTQREAHERAAEMGAALASAREREARLREALIAMGERWHACNEGRGPTAVENERRRCARELLRFVRAVPREEGLREKEEPTA